MIRATLLATALALPAHAGVEEALASHVLPRIDALAEGTATLAAAPCEPEALRAGFHAAADAWAGASHLTLGPAEEGARTQAIQFWPDARDATGRGLRLLRAQGEEAWTPETIARASVAARGLGALERLIHEDGGEPCALTLALADDLAATARAIRDGWRGEGGFAEAMRSAGAPGNGRFLAPEEARAALFTALLSGLEHVEARRLGEPLGTFDRPEPRRAEMRRAGRSLENVRLALASLRELAAALAHAPGTDAAFATALAAAEALDDPVFAGVADPQGRVRVEALQTAVRAVRAAAAAEIGGALGVTAGFNASDGD